MREPIENGLALMPQAASKTTRFAVADTSNIFSIRIFIIVRISITPTPDHVRNAEISMDLTTTSLIIIDTSAVAHLASEVNIIAPVDEEPLIN